MGLREGTRIVQSVLKDGGTEVEVAEALLKAGWRCLGGGTYKTAFTKSRVVLKVTGVIPLYGGTQRFGLQPERVPTSFDFARANDANETVGAWFRDYKEAPDWAKAVMSKPLKFVNENIGFFEYVPRIKPDDEMCWDGSCRALDSAFYDAEHNHGHRKDGTPVVYDGELRTSFKPLVWPW